MQEEACIQLAFLPGRKMGEFEEFLTDLSSKSRQGKL
jgi:hypothetical protein